jgi:general secretion pathway protein K
MKIRSWFENIHHFPFRQKRDSNDHGVALLLTIWVLALLSVIVGEFCHAMRTEVNIARNFKEKTEASYVSRAGLMQAIAELIRIETNPPLIVDDEAIKPEDEEEKIDWRINVPISDIPFGKGVYSVKIGNEAGKININKADENLLKMMLNKFDLDDGEKDIIVDSILDWRDPDDFSRLNGAEDEYYQSLPEPYDAGNDDFESVEELLLVRGITSEIFHAGLKDFVTVFGEKKGGGNTPVQVRRRRAARNTGAFSYDKININYASQSMLYALPQMTEEFVQEIIKFRKEKDLSMPDVLEIVGTNVYSEVAPFITTARDAKSPFFTIVSEGKSQEKGSVSHRIEVILEIDARSEQKYKILKWTDLG